VTPEEIGIIEYGTFVLDSKVLMVLGYENCGAVKATMDGKPVPLTLLNLIQKYRIL
ncbi:MAG: carbonic anhydrase, partial [Okeania sp. SIO4D6]|nr:carbonic anhydrase [Okeania sp. SIO4D6]